MKRDASPLAAALLMFVTFWFPTFGLASTGWRVGWVQLGVFLVMTAVTVLAARILLVRLPGSYVAALVRETALLYLTFLYVGVFVGLALQLVNLGVAVGIAIIVAGVVGAGVVVAYQRWAKPWLTTRNARPLAFLET